MSNGTSYAVFVILLLIDAIHGATALENPWRGNVNCSSMEEEKRCRCDPDCARYGDCCVNSLYFVPEQQVLGASPFTCTQLGYTMNKCSEAWGDEEFRRFCENPNSEIADPLLAAPVTSSSTNITYSNWHCAACNKDILSESTQIWPSKFSCLCDSFWEDSLVDSEAAATNLMYNSTTRSWQYKSLSSSTGSTDCKCNHFFMKPLEIYNIIRDCDDSIISKCADTWTDKQVQKECESYTDVRCSGLEKYRNYECVICNYKDLGLCFTQTYFAIEKSPSFSMLLDWKRLKRSNKCSKSEVFDPIVRVCRQVFLD